MASSRTIRRVKKKPIAVDLYCGAGGLTRGLLDAGIEVRAGYDIDEACRYAYEHNNSPSEFHAKSVVDLKAKDVKAHYEKGRASILVGCAPCVTFSTYTQGKNRSSDPKWSLLRQFARLVEEVRPDIISMENVPGIQKTSVFRDFLRVLRDEGFHFSERAEQRIVYCPDYGIPQHRTRLVLIASRLGSIQLIPPTNSPSEYRDVRDALKGLPELEAGGASQTDPMHRASALSDLNLRRIRHSKPGGSWRSWPAELVAKCHTKDEGKTYGSVYGRMSWSKPAPTITTQFHGFGNGRFGHPEQDRALSLREGAILQSFPRTYAFTEDSDYSVRAVARMIGNAVPVQLGAVIGKSIRLHLAEHGR
jgi:DNA (cytosine-5)-methyltransferase 1